MDFRPRYNENTNATITHNSENTFNTQQIDNRDLRSLYLQHSELNGNSSIHQQVPFQEQNGNFTYPQQQVQQLLQQPFQYSQPVQQQNQYIYQSSVNQYSQQHQQIAPTFYQGNVNPNTLDQGSDYSQYALQQYHEQKRKEAKHAMIIKSMGTFPTNFRRSYSRRRHKNSHFGCKQCKRRRIKCNEQFPICTNCIKSRLTCSYQSLTQNQIDTIMAKKQQQEEEDNFESMLEDPNSHEQPSTSNSRNVNINIHSRSISSDRSQFQLSPIDFSMNLGTSISAPIYGGPADLFSSSHQMLQPQVPASVEAIPGAMQEVVTFDPLPETPLQNGLNNNSSSSVIAPENSNDQITLPPVSKNYSNSLEPYQSIERDDHFGFESQKVKFRNHMKKLCHLAAQYEYLYYSIVNFGCLLLSSKVEDPQEVEYCLQQATKFRDLTSMEVNRRTNNLQSVAANGNIDEFSTLFASVIILSWDLYSPRSTLTAHLKSLEYCSKFAANNTNLPVFENDENYSVLCNEYMYQCLKYIHFPSYSHAFLGEFLKRLENVKPTLQGMLNQQDDYESKRMFENEFKFLHGIITRLNNYLNTVAAQPIKNDDSITSYSSEVLFNLLKEWISNFPSEACSFKPRRHPSFHVLYTYYHAASRSLDAFFPEIRYLFSMSFNGPVDLVSMDLQTMSSAVSSNVIPLLQYPFRIISFFKERLYKLSKLIIINNPFSVENDDTRNKSKKLKMIKEDFITSFEHDQITNDSFPQIDKANKDFDVGTIEGEFVLIGGNKETLDGSISPTTILTTDFQSHSTPVTVMDLMPVSSSSSSSCYSYCGGHGESDLSKGDSLQKYIVIRRSALSGLANQARQVYS